MKYLAFLAYDGTNYNGWQIQTNDRSIQEEIEKVLSKILNAPTKIFGSGRTDAGVHAINQTFDFTSKEIKDLDKFRYSLNCLLPNDIHINKIIRVSDDFSARFSAIGKTYLYRLNMGELDVFTRFYVAQVHQKLDINKIKEASKLFIGKHCYQNFTSKEEDKDNFVRIITSFEVTEDNNILSFKISGNGFMRYMIRMIVGTLIQVGLNKLEIKEVENILNNKDRKPVPFKADANGLSLLDVYYDEISNDSLKK